MSLIELGSESLAEVDSLRQAIGWGPGSWFLEPMLADGGCILAQRDETERLIAMGATALFEPFGFICNMVVDPSMKRRGLGREVFTGLLAWLKARGVEQVQLEATEEGQPLYEQFGFRTRWESVSASMPSAVAPGDESGISAVGPKDWAEIAALDRAAYGGDRAGFLELLAAAPSREDGLVLREAGRLTAFGFRYPGRIGPLVAGNAAAAERLARALASRAPVGTFATVGHPMHTAFWERLGFEVHPFDVRMAFGPEPDDHPEMVVSMLNGGVG